MRPKDGSPYVTDEERAAMEKLFPHLKTVERDDKPFVAAMQTIIESCERENRPRNAEENVAWSGLERRVCNVRKLLNHEAARSGKPRPFFDPNDKYIANDKYIDGNLGTDSGWRSANGQPVAVLNRGDKLRDVVSRGGFSDPGYEQLSFGRFVRAMVCGPTNELERRALSEGTDSAGGFTVPDVLSAELIDALRARTVVNRAGARTVALNTDTTTMARLATDPTTAWHTENATVTDSSPTFEGLTFTARTLISLVRASRELIEDSLNIERALTNAFAQSMAIEVDRVALLGSGVAPEPEGVKLVTGIGSIEMAGNGLALTNFDPLLDCLQTMADANAAFPTAAIMAPRTQIALAKLKDTANQPLQKPAVLEPLPLLVTTAMPVNETQGTANDASTIIFGDFSELFIGVRNTVRLEVLRERYSDNFQYGFLAHLRADIQLAHPASFCELIGIIP